MRFYIMIEPAYQETQVKLRAGQLLLKVVMQELG